MNKIFKASLVALATAFGASSTAHAGLFDFDPAEGNFYASGFGGIAFPFDAEIEGEDAELDSSAYFGGAIGARLPFKYWKYFQPRLELEISRYNSDFGDNVEDAGFTGGQSATFFLINNSSEFVWKENQQLVPYFGGGIGIADYDTDISNGVDTVGSSDTGFATLSTIGLNYKTTSQFDVYIEGRYLRTYGINEDLTGAGVSFDVDDDPQGITIAGGIRYNF